MVRMEATRIADLKNEAELELRMAEPELEAADQAVSELSSADVFELKKTVNPN